MTSKFWHKLRRINWDEDTYRDVVMSVGDDSVFLREPLHLYEFEISETGELYLVTRNEIPPWLFKKGNQIIPMEKKHKFLVVPQTQVNDYLDDMWRDTAVGSFRGRAHLYDKVKKLTVGIKFDDVKKFLEKQETYQLIKRAPKQKVTRPITSQSQPFDHFQMDLMDFTSFAKRNAKANQYHYVLVVVDIWSKYCWLKPCTVKTAPLVASKFKEILLDGFIPRKVQCDNGSEFTKTNTDGVPNKEFQALISQFGFEWRTSASYSASTNGGVERLNGTIKKALVSYFVDQNPENFFQALPEIQFAYNFATHSTTGFTPHMALFNQDMSNMVKVSSVLTNPRNWVEESNERGQSTTRNHDEEEKVYGTVKPIKGWKGKADNLAKKLDFTSRDELNKEVQDGIMKGGERMMNVKRKTAYKFDIGQKVRIKMNVNDVRGNKEYVESRFNWSEALFEITERVLESYDIIPRYKVKLISSIGGQEKENFAFNRSYTELELISVHEAEKKKLRLNTEIGGTGKTRAPNLPPRGKRTGITYDNYEPKAPVTRSSNKNKE
jgi:transposase InsO family protein